MTKQEIKEFLNSNIENKRFLENDEIYNIPAKILCWEIVKCLQVEFSQAKINPTHIVNENFYGKESHFQNNIKTSIAIQHRYNHEFIKLAENSSAKDKEEFSFGQYKINLFKVLADNNLKYFDLVKQGCLNAMNKYIELKEKEIALKTEQRSLLQQKLEILQNPELRNKEINKLSEQINTLDQEINI